MTKKHSARNGHILAGIHYGQWGGERTFYASRGADISTGPTGLGLSSIYPHETH